MELAKVSQDIQVYQEMLTSCEDAHSRSEVLKLITALVESKTALLQKEARLAGTAGGERLSCCMMSRYLWQVHLSATLLGSRRGVLCSGLQLECVLFWQLRLERTSLVAQMERHTSGEVEHHGSVPCCQASLAPGSRCLISMLQSQAGPPSGTRWE